jgi:hypothetical protein
MKRLIVAFAVVSIVIGLSLAASADPASTFKQVVDVSGENTCTEPVEFLSGTAVQHVVVHRHVVNGEERFFLKDRIAKVDLTGEFGTKYTGAASATTKAVVDANGGTIVDTFKSRLISKGAAENELGLITTRTTIDENGNVVEVEVIDFEIKCVG